MRLLFGLVSLAGMLLPLPVPAAHDDGTRLYTQHCAACHGAQGKGGVGVPLALPDKHPELLAYLPLKFTIFSEGEHTLVVTNNPAVFGVFFKESGLTHTFQHWEKDVRSMLDQLTRAP